jgi:hypothetical protein
MTVTLQTLQDFLIPELRQFNILGQNLLSARLCTLPLFYERATVTERRFSDKLEQFLGHLAHLI